MFSFVTVHGVPYMLIQSRAWWKGAFPAEFAEMHGKKLSLEVVSVKTDSGAPLSRSNPISHFFFPILRQSRYQRVYTGMRDCWMFLKFNQTINQHGHLFFLFNPHAPKSNVYCDTNFLPFLHKHSSNMPPRSSKNKSVTEKGAIAPITATSGRQRTQTTKQQLLRKSCIPLHSSFIVIFIFP